MNGNYEFANHMAKDKRSAFIREAQERRMAKQAGSRGEARSTRVYVARIGAWLLQVAYRTAGQVANQRPALRRARPVTH
ncbi:MAG TPA: hypothetical protein VLE70_07130 [Anaerolineae bacterium]|jgi:hypothetical protein|nr:hypothetical protein [Anaerolineae bacterium]